MVFLHRGDTLAEIERYGQWTSDKLGNHLVPQYLTTSDYTGSGLTLQSNIDSWSEDFVAGEDIWWKTVTGGHGTEAVIIDLEAVPEDVEEEVADFLNGLAEYPSADDDRLSQLESEAQGEAWKSWAKRDFIKALEKKFSSDLDDSNEDKIFELFTEAAEKSNTNWENEQGDSMHIDIDRIVKKISSKDLEKFGL